ncbi:MAG: circularly permuted type 2 ATP-grasp protein [Prolixibacteraceae bacterium]
MTIVHSSLLQNYQLGGTNDEMISPSLAIKPAWETLLKNIDLIGEKELSSRQEDLNWHLAENGVTYNVYNDPQGLNRPWNLNVTPSLITEKEWIKIEKGIQQRAELFNLILKDLYGKRELISNGIVPLEVIFSHRGFLRQCDQITSKTTKQLQIYGVDLSRGPDGRIWVISDRTQAPSGMGYALENRLTMGRVLPDLFQGMNVKKLTTFFQQFNNLLIDSSPRKIDNPNIVVLTPGPLNETYFEHSYLASYLGYSLVQGNDLVVRNQHLWMKSLKGLKKIDVVLRRVDDMFVDPLELREDSHLGVPGLLEVIRNKNVSIVNPVGSRVLENPGLVPFMQGIAKYFLNEPLILPQIASWWCGQEKERQYVLDNLPNLIVKRIDRSQTDNVFVGQQMSKAQLEALGKEILDRPYRFVAQDKISFTTTPTYLNGTLEPRNMVWRTFAIANKKEYSVMPGGLVRVAPDKDKAAVSNQIGGLSKDIWIVNEKDDNSQIKSSVNRKSSISLSGLDDLPSLTAENLYWAGRYVGRTLMTARFLRMALKQISYVQLNEGEPTSEDLQIILRAITNLTSTFPGFASEEEVKDPYQEILAVILDKKRIGSLAYTINLFSNAYFSIRNLWSSDMWRVFGRIENIWKEIQDDPDPNIRKIIQALDQLITRLIAFMSLVEESILIEQGLLLYFIGLQMEQSMLNISKCRSMLVFELEEQVEYEVLEALLNSHESLNIYRHSYRSHIKLENVIELLLLDMKYPRSLAYKLNRLLKDLSVLPHSKVSHELTKYEKFVFEAFSKLRLATTAQLIETDKSKMIRENLDQLLSELSELLHQTSLAVANTYFSHTYQQNQLVAQNFNA